MVKLRIGEFVRSEKEEGGREREMIIKKGKKMTSGKHHFKIREKFVPKKYRHAHTRTHTRRGERKERTLTVVATNKTITK